MLKSNHLLRLCTLLSISFFINGFFSPKVNAQKFHTNTTGCIVRMNDKTYSRSKVGCSACVDAITIDPVHDPNQLGPYYKTMIRVSTTKDQNAKDCESPPFVLGFVQEMAEAMVTKEDAREGSKVNYLWQQLLWWMSGADYMKNTKIEAYEKVRCLWNKHKEKMRCYGYDMVSVKDPNLLKFACDLGFQWEVIDLIETYGLDVNFIDPADGKSFMDFIIKRIEEVNNAKPVDEGNLKGFMAVYEILKKNKAKTSVEIRAMTKN